jgi:hypothetical protein
LQGGRSFGESTRPALLKARAGWFQIIYQQQKQTDQNEQR